MPVGIKCFIIELCSSSTGKVAVSYTHLDVYKRQILSFRYSDFKLRVRMVRPKSMHEKIRFELVK